MQYRQMTPLAIVLYAPFSLHRFCCVYDIMEISQTKRLVAVECVYKLESFPL